MRSSIFKFACLTVFMISFSACATQGGYIPTAEKAGPKPVDVQASLDRWKQANLVDPYSSRVEYVGELKPGAVWTGMVNSGYVPAWYVCTAINARNSFGGYTGLKTRAMFFRDEEIVFVAEGRSHNWHKFQC